MLFHSVYTQRQRDKTLMRYEYQSMKRKRKNRRSGRKVPLKGIIKSQRGTTFTDFNLFAVSGLINQCAGVKPPAKQCHSSELSLETM